MKPFRYYLTAFLSFYRTHKNEIDNFLQIYYIYFKYHHLHTDEEYIFRQFDKVIIAARVYNTLWDIGNMPIKCLSVHNTATIQNIHSFSLLHCTNTVYTQWTIKNILFILLLLKPGGCECIVREPFKIPEMFYSYTVKTTSASFIFYLTFIPFGGFKDINCNHSFLRSKIKQKMKTQHEILKWSNFFFLSRCSLSLSLLLSLLFSVFCHLQNKPYAVTYCMFGEKGQWHFVNSRGSHTSAGRSLHTACHSERLVESMDIQANAAVFSDYSNIYTRGSSYLHWHLTE